VIFIKSLK